MLMLDATQRPGDLDFHVFHYVSVWADVWIMLGNVDPCAAYVD